MWDGGGIDKQYLASPGRYIFHVKPNSTSGGFFLRVLNTTFRQYSQHTHYYAGLRIHLSEQPLAPLFLQRWQGMKVLRYIDFMQTHGATITNWTTRPQLSHATFSGLCCCRLFSRFIESHVH